MSTFTPDAAVADAARSSLGKVGLWTSLIDVHPAPVARDMAVRLEAMGWPSLWRPESTGRDAILSAASLLEATERLTLATGIAQTYARHPITAAAAQKTVAEAHPGRFILGLGVSHAPMVEGVRKLDYSRPYSDMVAYLAAMDEATYASIEPATRAPRILAALGPRMLKLSAEQADGAHPYFSPPEHTALSRDILGPTPVLAPEQMVILDTDPSSARELARSQMARYLALPNYVNNLLRMGFTQADVDDVSDRLVDVIVPWGDVDAAAAAVQNHLDAGADHVCVQLLVADPQQLPFEGWQRLAEALIE
ncbi:MAG: TIGR03620 family F420-dependent LLM class oxidoreductase [Acidimicrobiales bacterium]